MATFYHKFEIRWNDLDANFHLANASYVMFCSHTRMAFMSEMGMGFAELQKYGIGPVLLRENLMYYKEIRAAKEVYVSLEVSGLSDSGSIFSFEHKFYLPDGTHCATSKMYGVWLSMKTRKMIEPPAEFVQPLLDRKSPNCEILTLEDVKRLSPKPENIDPKAFLI